MMMKDGLNVGNIIFYVFFLFVYNKCVVVVWFWFFVGFFMGMGVVDDVDLFVLG